jgi:hypothetical protein
MSEAARRDKGSERAGVDWQRFVVDIKPYWTDKQIREALEKYGMDVQKVVAQEDWSAR